MARFHCICGIILALAGPAAPSALAQIPAGTETHGYIVFLRGAPVGREEVTTQTSIEGVVITGHGLLGPPIGITTSRVEVRYRPDWTPESLTIDGVVQGNTLTLKTTFNGTDAVSETTEAGKSTSETDKVSLQTIVVPNLFFGTYQALAHRLLTASPGTELPVFVAPQAEIPVRVRAIRTERVQTGNTIFNVRRYELGVANPGGDVIVQLSADEAGRLIRLTVPVQSIDVVREDVAASTSRTLIHSNPGDEPVTIPSNGFNLAATLTRPKTTAARAPAVVLLSGSGDRDGMVSGVPIMSQLAGALADAGFLVIRYDKRGFGQSGGRFESTTIDDLADDARTVIRYLNSRKDVDTRRIAVAGHGEGAWTAMLTASREGRVAAVVSIAAPATTGSEFLLEQQRQLLDSMQVPEPERQEKIELQKQIHAAVLSGVGIDKLPFEVRRQADTPWFQSLLRYDPTKVLKDIDKPLLIVHGELDHQIPISHASKLFELARTEGDSKTIEFVTVRGINHLLIRAVTGEIGEYPTLTDLTLSPDLSKSVTTWLTKVMAGR